MTSSIEPSVGRKVWFWADPGFGASIDDTEQACDATVLFVVDSQFHRVNLLVIDHRGNQRVAFNVQLRDPNPDGDKHFACEAECYATWTPYMMNVTRRSDELNAIQAALQREVTALEAKENSGVAKDSNLGATLPAPPPPPAT